MGGGRSDVAGDSGGAPCSPEGIGVHIRESGPSDRRRRSQSRHRYLARRSSASLTRYITPGRRDCALPPLPHRAPGRRRGTGLPTASRSSLRAMVARSVKCWCPPDAIDSALLERACLRAPAWRRSRLAKIIRNGMTSPCGAGCRPRIRRRRSDKRPRRAAVVRPECDRRFARLQLPSGGRIDR